MTTKSFISDNTVEMIEPEKNNKRGSIEKKKNYEITFLLSIQYRETGLMN